MTPSTTIVQKAFAEMARRTERLPRAAIARTLGEFYKHPTRIGEHNLTRQVFPGLIEAAQERGELPADADPLDLADMLNALDDHRGGRLGPRRVPEPGAGARVPLARACSPGVRAEHATG